MNPRLRIATRGSHLALAQSRYIQSRIAATPNAPQTELVIIKTSGDANQVLSLAEAAGGDARKGLFTKEIEDALLGDHADIAVHSFKDLPTQMVEGLRICAVPQRIESLDILVFPKVKKAYDRLPYVREGSTIGTSSARRV
ncbi:MAG TPA: hydroxymethylbilane synthase, partial [Leptospiraceae bacterium]|nr:hydroxymethylbilane synthase [Leptospiraceae bacterium]